MLHGCRCSGYPKHISWSLNMSPELFIRNLYRPHLQSRGPDFRSHSRLRAHRKTLGCYDLRMLKGEPEGRRVRKPLLCIPLTVCSICREIPGQAMRLKRLCISLYVGPNLELHGLVISHIDYCFVRSQSTFSRNP